jgi:hypothetical protein
MFFTSYVLFVFQVMKRRFGRDLPEFHNLRTLILEQCRFTCDAPTLLEFFLRIAPNLDRLTLQNCTVKHQDYISTCKDVTYNFH